MDLKITQAWIHVNIVCLYSGESIKHWIEYNSLTAASIFETLGEVIEDLHLVWDVNSVAANHFVVLISSDAIQHLYIYIVIYFLFSITADNCVEE